MALMLRKAAQPVLNGYDLDAFHADLNGPDKSLRIYTPCGKLFATVSGVQFGGLNPTKAEIEFAMELLENWLLRNKDKIDKYIEAFETLQRMPPYRLKNKEETIEVSCATQWVSRDQSSKITGIRYVTVLQDTVAFDIDNHGYITKVAVQEPILYPGTASLTLSPENYQEAMTLLADAILLSDQERLVEYLVAELNVCET